MGALPAVEAGEVGPEDLHVVAHLGQGADGRAGGADAVALFEGDGGRDAFDGVDAWLVHAVEELPGVGGEGLDIASLALGVEGVEGEGGLAGAAEAGDDHEIAGGQVEVEALQVVLAGAADSDHRVSPICLRSHVGGDDREGTEAVNGAWLGGAPGALGGEPDRKPVPW